MLLHANVNDIERYSRLQLLVIMPTFLGVVVSCMDSILRVSRKLGEVIAYCHACRWFISIQAAINREIEVLKGVGIIFCA
jgi:hypothetical protein